MKERFHPDDVVAYDGFRIYPDGDTRGQELINIGSTVLGSQKGFRKVVYKDRVAEVVFSTQEQAIRDVNDLKIHRLTRYMGLHPNLHGFFSRNMLKLSQLQSLTKNG